MYHVKVEAARDFLADFEVGGPDAEIGLAGRMTGARHDLCEAEGSIRGSKLESSASIKKREGSVCVEKTLVDWSSNLRVCLRRWSDIRTVFISEIEVMAVDGGRERTRKISTCERNAQALYCLSGFAG